MIDRIRKLIASEQMNPSKFADEIKFQRSSLSHVLSGRNKPSLDFVMKIKQRFSEVNLEWLIFGDGDMLLTKQDESVHKSDNDSTFNESDETRHLINIESKSQTEYSSKSKEPELSTKNMESFELNTSSGMVERVIIFFNNGTFKEYVKSTT